MIVDASAILAIVKREPEHERFLTALASADQPTMSVVNHFEVAIKVDRYPDPVWVRRTAELIKKARIELAPVTVEHAAIARQAYRDFGRGSGHPAKLNLGDCFAYALATATGKPLLFKGDDFIHTDVRPAV